MRALGTPPSLPLSTLGGQGMGTWDSLISGYIQSGNPQQALTLYKTMQIDGSVHPSGRGFVALLKVCAKLRDLQMGVELHADVVRRGLHENDPFIGSTLVDMYAKCGLLTKAQEAFDRLPLRDTVSWTVLMAGYNDHGCGEKALGCFDRMQHEGVLPNAFTIACGLKACGNILALDKGREIHADIERWGFLERDIFVGSSLIDMYTKCGFLGSAQVVFNRLPVRNVVSWTVLIGGYAEFGYSEEALECFKRMRLQGVSPNAATFVCALKACGSIRAEHKGVAIHAEVERWGLLERELVVGSSLVDMYVKCGSLGKAQQVFGKLPVRNVVLWNALATGYAEHGQGKEALKCVEQMQSEGISPNSVTYLCCLKACCSTGDTDDGQAIHVEIERMGFLENEVTLGNALIDMYAKMGLLAKARQVFDKLPARSLVSWNALIAGYAEHGHGEEALQCLEQMRLEGFFPNALTFVCSLKACGSIGAMRKGGEIYAGIVTMGSVQTNLLVLSALVDMYAKGGLLSKAQQVFDMLPDRDVVSWTSLIAGYADHGHGEEALKFLEEMVFDGVSPNAITLICSLKACGSLGAKHKALEILEEVEREGLLERDLFVGNTVVDVYAKCDLLSKAQGVFDKLPFRNVVLWNTLLAAYTIHDYSEEALNCFKRMQVEGISPDSGTFVCILRACGRAGSADRGREIHAEIERHGLVERDLVIANSLVDMYAKCGLLSVAQRVFDKLLARGIASCNSLMAGYAQLGDSKNVFSVFNRLVGDGLKPDLITFYTVLNTFCCTSLSSKSEMYLEAMSRDYGVPPTIQLLSCMVDILGRAGRLDYAVRMIREMGVSSNYSPWHSILSASRTCGNLDLAKLAFQHARCLNDQMP